MHIGLPALFLSRLGSSPGGAGEPLTLLQETVVSSPAQTVSFTGLTQGEAYRIVATMPAPIHFQASLIGAQFLSGTTPLTFSEDGTSYRYESLYNNPSYTVIFGQLANMGLGTAIRSASQSCAHTMDFFCGEETAGYEAWGHGDDTISGVILTYGVSAKPSSIADGIRLGWSENGGATFIEDAFQIGAKISLYKVEVAA